MHTKLNTDRSPFRCPCFWKCVRIWRSVCRYRPALLRRVTRASAQAGDGNRPHAGVRAARASGVVFCRTPGCDYTDRLDPGPTWTSDRRTWYRRFRGAKTDGESRWAKLATRMRLHDRSFLQWCDTLGSQQTKRLTRWRLDRDCSDLHRSARTRWTTGGRSGILTKWPLRWPISTAAPAIASWAAQPGPYSLQHVRARQRLRRPPLCCGPSGDTHRPAAAQKAIKAGREPSGPFRTARNGQT